VDRTKIILLAAAMAIAGLGTIAVPFLARARTSNCGGNSAALSNVRRYHSIVRQAALENADHTFRVTSLAAGQQDELAKVARYHWIPHARFYVSTTPFSEKQTASNQVIIVCATAYNNVPRRWIGSAPYTHAAALADGTTKLISPAELSALDRSSFVFLDELCPAK
jgi:hypothetical protein